MVLTKLFKNQFIKCLVTKMYLFYVFDKWITFKLFSTSHLVRSLNFMLNTFKLSSTAVSSLTVALFAVMITTFSHSYDHNDLPVLKFYSTGDGTHGLEGQSTFFKNSSFSFQSSDNASFSRLKKTFFGSFNDAPFRLSKENDQNLSAIPHLKTMHRYSEDYEPKQPLSFRYSFVPSFPTEEHQIQLLRNVYPIKISEINSKDALEDIINIVFQQNLVEDDQEVPNEVLHQELAEDDLQDDPIEVVLHQDLGENGLQDDGAIEIQQAHVEQVDFWDQGGYEDNEEFQALDLPDVSEHEEKNETSNDDLDDEAGPRSAMLQLATIETENYFDRASTEDQEDFGVTVPPHQRRVNFLELPHSKRRQSAPLPLISGGFDASKSKRAEKNRRASFPMSNKERQEYNMDRLRRKREIYPKTCHACQGNCYADFDSMIRQRI